MNTAADIIPIMHADENEYTAGSASYESEASNAARRKARR
jgi:hypothetical protein